MDLEEWLSGLGLQQYVSAFRDNAIDAEILPQLTEADLEKLGVVLGHRKRLLKEITLLQAGAGAASDTRTPHTRSELHVPAIVQVERRQLTIMFADLVGSTALSARLDPEELRGLLRTYQDAVASAVVRFGGHVAKFMGDGILAYFGWPRAHEDDVERAVRSGLAIVDCVGQLQTPAGEPLSTRVGIATGLVVVGDLLGEGAAREEAVVGETPNLAARLQAMAAPGCVVVAEGTRRLLGKGFELQALTPRPLKGLGEAVPAFRVMAERLIGSRFEARQSSAVLPLVGRESELTLLLNLWRLARGGQGQAVLLVGEAGIGKSRIAKELSDAVANERHTTVRYQCSSYHTDSPLWPVIEQLTFAVGFTRDDDDAARIRKLKAMLQPVSGKAARSAVLFAQLFGIESAAPHRILDLTPQQRRARTLAALTDYLVGFAAGRPTLVIFEDVHWIDPTSLELVEQVLERIARSYVLVILTSRPNSPPQLSARSWLTRLTLDRLDRQASSAIVRELSHGKPLPPDLEEAIARRTDGVPLFIEELTKAVLEAGQFRGTEGGWAIEDSLPLYVIPNSLQDSLMARLDRLGSVKQVAQIAACIGREFDRALLSACQSRLIHRLPRLMSLQQAVVGLAGSRAVSRDRPARVLHAADGGRKTRSSSAM
jgi:class 3 adenylate cyclase